MMDLTPLEVRKKKGDFRRQIRGYDPESVDDFLDLVADRLETLVRENAALTETSSALEQRVSEYRQREKALTEALVSAQQLREQMRAAAAKEAEQARTEAERDASEQRSLAAQEAEQARREARALLDQAKAEAAHEIESARRAAAQELDRIRAELARIREQETQTIRALRSQRDELLATYGDLLAGQVEALQSLRATITDEPLPDWDEQQVEAGVHAATAPETSGVVVEPFAVADAPAFEVPAQPAGVVLSEAPVEPVDEVVLEEPVDVAGEADEVVVLEEPADEVGEEAIELVEAAEAFDAAVLEEPVEPFEPAAPAVPEAAAFGMPRETAATGVEAELPALSPDLAALIEAAESEVEEAWLTTADEEADDWSEATLAEDAAGSELLLEADEEIDVAAPVEGPESGELVLGEVESGAAMDGDIDGPDSDEAFIDSLIAQAGVRPTQNGRPPVAPPPFLETEEEPAPAPEPEAVLDEAPVAEEAETLVLEAEVEDFAEETGEPETAEQAPVAADGSFEDPFLLLDEDESFDALFDDGEDEGGEFDFDAALASATGLPGYPTGSADRDNPFGMSVEPDDPHVTADLRPGATSAFTLNSGTPSPTNGFSPARPGELTLRPLSAEEEAPELPSEPQEHDDRDDDMFSTMFSGRE